MNKLDEFITYVKSKWNRVDYDKFYGYQCSDLNREWLKFQWLQQYKPLWNNWVIVIANSPSTYLVEPMKWIKNDPSNPNQVPNVWDNIIFWKPVSTWHIGIVYSAEKWSNNIYVFEQNAWSWNWDWLWDNACKIWHYNYNNVLWRFTSWIELEWNNSTKTSHSDEIKILFEDWLRNWELWTLDERMLVILSRVYKYAKENN